MKVIRDRICDAVHKCLKWEDGEIDGIDMLKLEQHIDGILAQLKQHDVTSSAAKGMKTELKARMILGLPNDDYKKRI